MDNILNYIDPLAAKKIQEAAEFEMMPDSEWLKLNVEKFLHRNSPDTYFNIYPSGYLTGNKRRQQFIKSIDSPGIPGLFYCPLTILNRCEYAKFLFLNL